MSTSGGSSNSKTSEASRVFVLTPDMLKKLGLSDEIKLLQSEPKPKKKPQVSATPKKSRTLKPRRVIPSSKVRIISKRKTDTEAKRQLKPSRHPPKTKELDKTDENKGKVIRKPFVIPKILKVIPGGLRDQKTAPRDEQTTGTPGNSSRKGGIIRKKKDPEVNRKKFMSDAVENVELVIHEENNNPGTESLQQDRTISQRKESPETITSLDSMHNPWREKKSLPENPREGSGDKPQEVEPAEDHIEIELSRMNLWQSPPRNRIERVNSENIEDDLMDILGNEDDFSLIEGDLITGAGVDESLDDKSRGNSTAREVSRTEREDSSDSMRKNGKSPEKKLNSLGISSGDAPDNSGKVIQDIKLPEFAGLAESAGGMKGPELIQASAGVNYQLESPGERIQTSSDKSTVQDPTSTNLSSDNQRTAPKALPRIRNTRILRPKPNICRQSPRGRQKTNETSTPLPSLNLQSPPKSEASCEQLVINESPGESKNPAAPHSDPHPQKSSDEIPPLVVDRKPEDQIVNNESFTKPLDNLDLLMAAVDINLKQKHSGGINSIARCGNVKALDDVSSSVTQPMELEEENLTETLGLKMADDGEKRDVIDSNDSNGMIVSDGVDLARPVPPEEPKTEASDIPVKLEEKSLANDRDVIVPCPVSKSLGNPPRAVRKKSRVPPPAVSNRRTSLRAKVRESENKDKQNLEIVTSLTSNSSSGGSTGGKTEAEVKPRRKRTSKKDLEDSKPPKIARKIQENVPHVETEETAARSPIRTSRRQSKPKIYEDCIMWTSMSHRVLENHTDVVSDLSIRKSGQRRSKKISERNSPTKLDNGGNINDSVTDIEIKEEYDERIINSCVENEEEGELNPEEKIVEGSEQLTTPGESGVHHSEADNHDSRNYPDVSSSLKRKSRASEGHSKKKTNSRAAQKVKPENFSGENSSTSDLKMKIIGEKSVQSSESIAIDNDDVIVPLKSLKNPQRPVRKRRRMASVKMSNKKDPLRGARDSVDGNEDVDLGISGPLKRSGMIDKRIIAAGKIGSGSASRESSQESETPEDVRKEGRVKPQGNTPSRKKSRRSKLIVEEQIELHGCEAEENPVETPPVLSREEIPLEKTSEVPVALKIPPRLDKNPKKSQKTLKEMPPLPPLVLESIREISAGPDEEFPGHPTPMILEEVSSLKDDPERSVSLKNRDLPEDAPEDINTSAVRRRKLLANPEETDGEGLSGSSEEVDPLPAPPHRRRGRRGRRGRGRGRGPSTLPVDRDYTPRVCNPPSSTPAPVPKKIAEKTQKCGKCQEEMSTSQWSHHNFSKHNNMGWKFDQPQPDFSDVKALTSLLAKVKKKKSFLTCESCSTKKRSVAGFMSHITFCGKTEIEKQSLMWTCPICRVILMPSSQEYHEKVHRDLGSIPKKKKEMQMEIPKEPVDLDSSRIKRKAAERAATKISEFTDLVKGSDEVLPKKKKLTAKIRELIERPVITKKISGVWKAMWSRAITHNEKAYCREPGCDFSAPTLVEICKHYVTCNFTARTTFICKVCRFSCEPKAEIVQHVKDEHSSEIQGNDSDYNASDSEEDEEEDNEEIAEDKEPMRKRKLGPRQPLRPKAKFLGNPIQYKNLPSNMTYPPAIEWTMEFQEKCYDLELFSELQVNEMKRVEEPADFLPEEKLSMSTRVKVKEKGSGNNSWRRWKRFEGDVVGDVPTFFTGGPVWALAWLPIPPTMYNEENEQFVAVSTHKGMEDTFEVGRSYSGRNSIQIWSLGSLRHDNDVPSAPKFCYAVGHEGGTVWCMEWCPSGAYQRGRMGLLAAAMSSGDVLIFSLPLPQEFNQGKGKKRDKRKDEEKVFKTEPVMILKVNTPGEMSSQCMTLNWMKTKGHDTLAAGFANGYVALWHLTTESPLLKYQVKSTIHLDAFMHFYAHRHAVMFVTLIPGEEKRYLVTAGMDRCSKVWDLEDTSLPFEFLKKGVAVNGTWLTHWPAILASYDDVLGFGHTQTYLAPVREPVSKVIAILPTNSPVYALASSDWANGICQGTAAGEVVAIFPPQMLYLREIDKLSKARWLLSDVEIIDFKGMDQGNEYNYKPERYKECQERFGVEFREDFYNSSGHSRPPQDRKSALNTDAMRKMPVEQYPFAAINRISWSPNGSCYLWIAVGYRNGLVRVLNFKKMNKSSITNDLLSQHAAAMRAKGETSKNQ